MPAPGERLCWTLILATAVVVSFLVGRSTPPDPQGHADSSQVQAPERTQVTALRGDDNLGQLLAEIHALREELTARNAGHEIRDLREEIDALRGELQARSTDDEVDALREELHALRTSDQSADQVAVEQEPNVRELEVVEAGHALLDDVTSYGHLDQATHFAFGELVAQLPQAQKKELLSRLFVEINEQRVMLEPL